MRYFSKMEHIAHYKRKNQNTVKTNFREPFFKATKRHTGELISAQKTSHKHTKDPGRLR